MSNTNEPLITLAEEQFEGQLTDAEKKLFEAVTRHEEANFIGDGDQQSPLESSEQWSDQR